MSKISTCAQFVRDLKELTVISEKAVGSFYFNEKGFSFGIIFNEQDKLSWNPECQPTIVRGFKELFPEHNISIRRDECSITFTVS
mgnify:CR=1 FL=1